MPDVKSPSSRRAWIEISLSNDMLRSKVVALLAEGVDRNAEKAMDKLPKSGRPPHGGRG